MAWPNQRLNQSHIPYWQYHPRIQERDVAHMALESLVVARIHEEFRNLPTKCWPRRYGANNEFTEWTALAGIAVVGPNDAIEHKSLASGLKCIPRTTVAVAKGCILHDSHAEILAIRVFNRFLLEEVEKMLKGRSGNGNDLSKVVEYQSNIVQWRDGSNEPSSANSDHWQPPFKIKDGLRIFMYCSEMPCGDASIELVLSRQPDQRPWRIDESVANDEGLKGMSHLSQLGIVRRKPGRADSQYTGSKSCSDKLALKQCTSLLSSLTAAFITPDNAYIDTVIFPQVQCNLYACTRSFGREGRMKAVSGTRWANGYHFNPFRVATTTIPFAYARPCYNGAVVDANGTVKGQIGNSNVTAIRGSSLIECIINGVLQGRTQDDPKGATTISRLSMMDLALRIRGFFHTHATSSQDQVTTAPPQPHGSVRPKAPSPRTLDTAGYLVELKMAPAAPGFVNNEAQHASAGGEAIQLFKGAKTYYEAKGDAALEARRQVKRDVTAVALQNWIPNDRDDFPIGLSRP